MSWREMLLFASFQLLLLIPGLFLSDTVAFPKSEVEALNSFKRSVYDDPSLALSNWNPVDSNPCNWTGVACTLAGDHVVKLNISYASLRGFLVPEFHLLPELQELILHQNLLIGAIPREIFLLKNLQVLDLGSNQLTGSIPPEIGNLRNISQINLQSNRLTGQLPSEIGNLKHLKVLLLNRNKLVGSIPPANISEVRSSKGGVMGLCAAAGLQVVDLSYNSFVGFIPKCLDYVPRSSFQGNCLQEKSPLQRPPSLCYDRRPVTKLKGKQEEDSRHRSGGSKPMWLLVLEVVTGTVVGSVFTIALFTAFQKWKTAPSKFMPWIKSASFNVYNAISIDPTFLKDAVSYSRLELEVACEDFSNIIGSSLDHQVYKGTLKPGLEIAVSSLCIKEDNWSGYSEFYFQNEVADLIRLSHENVGKLLGYCRESHPFTRMLVFEYVSNGTLYEHLHDGEGCQLSWPRRMKIAVGIARGLKHLHTEADPPLTLPHLDSSCVYLDEHFSPKLMVFDCWKTIFARSRKSSATISNNGPVCIMPGSLEKRNMDVHGNIQAFGVILLEIISGRTPYSKEKGSIVDWAKEFLESDVVTYMVDPELKHFRYEDLKAVCQVVKLCLNSVAKSMSELCDVLEKGVDLTAVGVGGNASLAWAELALSP